MSFSTSKILRTPDQQFQNLTDFDYEPNYLTVNGMRIHYLDEGPRDSEITVMLLHGQPSWSYLYRHMIPLLAQHYRVIAFDFIGFGRSDKYASVSDYSVQLHVDTLESVVEQLQLEQISLVMQDWGGPTGLLYLERQPQKVHSIVLMNTLLAHSGYLQWWPLSNWRNNVTFLAYRWMTRFTDFKLSAIFQSSTVKKLSREEMAGYYAPFPDQSYQAAARAWPSLVPIHRSNKDLPAMRKAWQFLASWQQPVLIMFSDQDPFTRCWGPNFSQQLPAHNQTQVAIKDAGHFLQEDQGPQLAQNIIEFLQAQKG
jgi:haloalkane dehalogenase